MKTTLQLCIPEMEEIWALEIIIFQIPAEIYTLTEGRFFPGFDPSQKNKIRFQLSFLAGPLVGNEGSFIPNIPM